MSAVAAPEIDLSELVTVIDAVIEPRALAIDREGAFPREGVRALAAAGYLGLVSSPEVGGRGQGVRSAAGVIRELSGHCGSTAMVLLMHYAAALVVEAHGSTEARRAVGSGRALATLAFSEAGSRSHFWAPVGSATRTPDGIRLDAMKSWVTSAGQADLYVWSSRPVEAEGLSSIWLVPSGTPGLSVTAPFDGLGLRGNASSPVAADGVTIREGHRLGPDGGGFEVMMGVVLPAFQIMSAAFSVGLMAKATQRAADHVARTTLSHLGQSLADLPTIRAYLARMRVRTDAAWALVLDTLAAVENEREDTMLRVLEVKAEAGEAATEVTDLAMRVCGGAAFRKEAGIERLFRDARAATVMAPTSDVLYDFIGKALCGLPLF